MKWWLNTNKELLAQLVWLQENSRKRKASDANASTTVLILKDYIMTQERGSVFLSSYYNRGSQNCEKQKFRADIISFKINIYGITA